MSTRAVVFLLLDATRADRCGAWGNPNPTTPTLDALAAQGVLFRRHFANAHATRSSFPQLMSGRYFHQNILRPFTADEHPREFPFSRPEPGAILLPELLRRHGYRTIGVSAHPWVVAQSRLGEHFDRVDFIAVDPNRGHADAPEVVERALGLWRERDRARPLFLYLHFMDMHMPRPLPEGEPRFPVTGFDWRRRFAPDSEPLFNPRARQWSQFEARDFTDLDRRHFAAVYDTRLAFTDEHIGRLLAAVGADDPELRQTLIVVVADHGEELGEDGRTGHGGSLADGVQHVPWIMAGAGIRPGQKADRFTENIDVAPTVLALLGVPSPPEAQMDGRAQLTREGSVSPDHGKPAVYYVWEEYRAVRTRRYLLRQEIPDSFRARCRGREFLYRLEGSRRVPLEPGRHEPVAARLRQRLARRLDAREQTFLAHRYAPPASPFFLRPEFWRLGPDVEVACLPSDIGLTRGRVSAAGWLWSGRGVTVLHSDGDRPLSIALPAPDGEYRVELATVPIKPPPWFFGFDRWLRRSFLRTAPAASLPLGTFRSEGGALSLRIPPSAGMGNHIIGLRLVPLGAAPQTGPTTPADEEAELHRRLKALGYVE